MKMRGTLWFSLGVLLILIGSITSIAVVGRLPERYLDLFLMAIIGALAPTLASIVAALNAGKANAKLDAVEHKVDDVQNTANIVEEKVKNGRDL